MTAVGHSLLLATEAPICPPSLSSRDIHCLLETEAPICPPALSSRDIFCLLGTRDCETLTMTHCFFCAGTNDNTRATQKV